MQYMLLIDEIMFFFCDYVRRFDSEKTRLDIFSLVCKL